MLAKKFILNKHYDGIPKTSDFKIIEEILPPLQNGEILCKGEWHSVDPYMRFFSASTKLGDIIPGSQVARVLESKNPEYPVGCSVVGNFGWRNLTICKPKLKSEESMSERPIVRQLIDMKGLPDSYGLGAVGMPGNTAYFGFTRVCEPKPGNTVVVSAGAGAVGSLVGQIAKIKGCKVLGFAGTEDKLKWMKDSLGFDHVFNYKTIDVNKTLKEYAPEGIDCYFDNVGGEFAYHVMKNMNKFGRIALCGAISTYNQDANLALVPIDYVSLVYRAIRMEGFLVTYYSKEWNEGLIQMRDWILEGKLKVEETIVEGFDNMPQAFIELLEGKNIGKMVVKA